MWPQHCRCVVSFGLSMGHTPVRRPKSNGPETTRRSHVILAFDVLCPGHMKLQGSSKHRNGRNRENPWVITRHAEEACTMFRKCLYPYGCRIFSGWKLSMHNFHTRSSYDYVPIEGQYAVLQGPCWPLRVKLHIIRVYLVNITRRCTNGSHRAPYGTARMTKRMFTSHYMASQGPARTVPAYIILREFQIHRDPYGAHTFTLRNPFVL